ncbi:unnamed protein product [Penicillium egyptiacum]|uniref:Uncharacterized protein n=1 Tax=Penicillium egyptiacum TaxID=1303716 RepID=A0A9W4KJ72_9EURO|nr:unnamed protein product [Penicillium egyptiacum]
MNSRLDYGAALTFVRNVESVQAQLDTLMENLRLCRGDNIGSRDPVHCLLIRLNRDQECYSFLKWWQHPLKTRSTIGAMQPCHTWISERPIHLSQSSLSREIQGLSHIVSLTLVKIKLYFVLLTAHGAQAYEEATEKNRKIMDGMIDIRTSTIARNPHVANLTILEAQPAIENVKAQIRKLYHTGNKANPYFWPEVINPNESLNAAPSMCSPGSKQEMEATMMWTWQARNESFGALEIVYAAVNDPKDEFIFLII